MTLLIALLLLSHMGYLNGWTYTGTIILWFIRFIYHSKNK